MIFDDIVESSSSTYNSVQDNDLVAQRSFIQSRISNSFRVLSNLSPRHASMKELKHVLSLVHDGFVRNQAISNTAKFGSIYNAQNENGTHSHAGMGRKASQKNGSFALNDPRISREDSLVSTSSVHSYREKANWNTNCDINAEKEGSVKRDLGDSEDLLFGLNCDKEASASEWNDVEDLNSVDGLRNAVAVRDERIALCVEMGQGLITRLEECNAAHDEELRLLKVQIDQQHAQIQQQRHLLIVLDSIKAERDALKKTFDENNQYVMGLKHKEWIHNRLEEQLRETQDQISYWSREYLVFQSILMSFCDSVKDELFEAFSQLHVAKCQMFSTVDRIVRDGTTLHKNLVHEIQCVNRFNQALLRQLVLLEQDGRREMDEVTMDGLRVLCSTAHNTVPSYGVIQMRRRVHVQDNETAQLRDRIEEAKKSEALIEQLQYRNKLLQDQLKDIQSKQTDSSTTKSVKKETSNIPSRPCSVSTANYSNLMEDELRREVRSLRTKIGLLETLNAEIRSENARLQRS